MGSREPTTAILHQRGRDSENSCSVHKVGRLSSLRLALKAWRVPGLILGTLKKWILLSVKECCSIRADEPDDGHEGKEVRSKASFFCIQRWTAARRCHPRLGWVFLVWIIRSRKSLTRMPNSSCFSCCRSSQVDNQDELSQSWMRLGDSFSLMSAKGASEYGNGSFSLSPCC